MEYVLGLNDDTIPEAIIAGSFMDYFKLVVKNHCYNGIKIEGGVILIDYYDRAENAYTEKGSTHIL